MKEIILTQGKVAIVDDEDFAWLNQWNWVAVNNNGYWYAIRSLKGTRQHLYMHRSILNPPEGYECDHIDGDGLNNQRCNIRICTHSQNIMNGHRVWGSSIYKGVWYIKSTRKWGARLRLNGKPIHLGFYKSEIDAAKAYNEAATKYFGEFARLNEVG